MPTGSNTIFFITKAEVPTGRKATYANAICDYRPTKDDPWRVRLTVGGDKLDYPGDPGAPAASLLEAKLILNSVISTKGAKFLTADIKDYFLNNPMDRYEYMKIPVRWIPEEILKQYSLADKIGADGYVYVEIRKGMYGLKQAARIAYDRLVLLMELRLSPIRDSPGLWKHTTRPTVFLSGVHDQVHRRQTCKPFPRHAEKISQNFCRLGGTDMRLTLQWSTWRYVAFNAWLHQKSFAPIPASPSTQTPTCTTRMDSSDIWCQGPICKRTDPAPHSR
jgi:hypothetical protein